MAKKYNTDPMPRLTKGNTQPLSLVGSGPETTAPRPSPEAIAPDAPQAGGATGLPSPELRKEEVQSIFRSLSESLGDPSMRAVAPESEERQYVEPGSPAPRNRTPALEAPVVIRQSVLDEPVLVVSAQAEAEGTQITAPRLAPSSPSRGPVARRSTAAWALGLAAAAVLLIALALRVLGGDSNTAPSSPISTVTPEQNVPAVPPRDVPAPPAPPVSAVVAPAALPIATAPMSVAPPPGAPRPGVTSPRPTAAVAPPPSLPAKGTKPAPSKDTSKFMLPDQP